MTVAIGCAGAKSGPAQPASAKTPGKGTPSGGSNPKAIVTPVSGLAGKVTTVNLSYQFVVVTFEGGQQPLPEQKLAVYRASLKVGEIKVSRQQMGRNVVADIVAGEARAGDEVRSE